MATRKAKEDALLQKYGWVVLRDKDEIEAAKIKKVISGKPGACRAAFQRGIRRAALKAIRVYLLTEA